jgi:uncharacterized membrane protein YjfL (UPF0719 family)
MNLFATINPAEIVATIVYTFIGVGLMGLCWWIITRFAPFPVIKEIEHDQNVALAVLIGSVFLSLAIIIAAVITS